MSEDMWEIFHKARLARTLANQPRYTYRACLKCDLPVGFPIATFERERAICTQHGSAYKFRVISVGGGRGPTVEDPQADILDVADTPLPPGREPLKTHQIVTPNMASWTPARRDAHAAHLKQVWEKKKKAKETQ